MNKLQTFALVGAIMAAAALSITTLAPMQAFAQAILPMLPPPTTSNTQTANVCGSATSISFPQGSGCVNNQQFLSDFDFTG